MVYEEHDLYNMWGYSWIFHIYVSLPDDKSFGLQSHQTINIYIYIYLP